MLDKAEVADVMKGEVRRGKTRRTTLIVGTIVAVAVLGIGGWMWWAASQRSPAESYTTEAAALGDIHVTLVATGTLQPRQQVDVSSTVSGTVASVDVDYNQKVSKGQALAHLDMRDLEVALSRARAMVDVQKAASLSAEANLADAKAALTRAEALAESNAISQRDVDLARTTVRRAAANAAAAAAQILAAEADLQSALNDYDRGEIVSPIDGVVLDINVEPGQSYGATSLGQALFVVGSDLGQLDLEVDIDEADVAQVTQGDKASFTVESSPNKPFDGVIRQIRSAPTVADGVVSYKALVAVDNPAGLLKPGMTATADIAVDDAIGVLIVPNAALRFSPAATVSGPFASMLPKSTVEVRPGDEQTVWVLADGKAKPVSVVAGMTDGQSTEISGGDLKPGDLVITGNKAP